MVSKLLVACFMLALCVSIHAGGLTAAIRWLRRSPVPAPGFWTSTRHFILVAVWIVVLHLVEISAWALAYFWDGAMPDLSSASYFSVVTYTTTGYGDLVLPKEWRLVGGVEALTGILMCGWSTGFFFALVNRLYEPQHKTPIV